RGRACRALPASTSSWAWARVAPLPPFFPVGPDWAARGRARTSAAARSEGRADGRRVRRGRMGSILTPPRLVQSSPAMPTPDPIAIAAALSARVMGQEIAVREMSVALAKHLAGLRVGNILMIGSSGTGKTTLMRAVEGYLAADPALASRSAVIRIPANVLGEEASRQRPGEAVLGRLLERAREQLGPGAPVAEVVARAAHGLVFVDEVDKIRTQIGGQPHVAGIRAQEALLTLIENE